MHIDLNSRSFRYSTTWKAPLGLNIDYLSVFWPEVSNDGIRIVLGSGFGKTEPFFVFFFSFLQTLSCSAALHSVLKGKHDCPSDICLLFVCVKLLLVLASVHNSSQSNFSLTTKHFWRISLSGWSRLVWFKKEEKHLEFCQQLQVFLTLQRMAWCNT